MSTRGCAKFTQTVVGLRALLPFVELVYKVKQACILLSVNLTSIYLFIYEYEIINIFHNLPRMRAKNEQLSIFLCLNAVY